jgi:hypothetical protein
MLGIVVGALALGVGILHFFLGPISPPNPLEEVVADQAARIHAAVVAKVKGQEAPAPEPETSRFDPDRIVSSGSAVAGFVALMFGVVAFVRREDIRMTGSAAALGAGAIAFQFVLIALGAIVLAIMIAGALSALASG